MTDLYDGDGNKVEALTTEEAATKAKEAVDAEIAKNADKEKNFAKLREESEAKEKVLLSEKEAAEKALADKEAEIVNKGRTAMIDNLSEGKADLKAKIELHIKQREAEIKTPEDFQRILNDAYTVSAGHVVPDKLAGVISSAGAKPGEGGNNNLPISQEALNVAYKLGVTDEDLKKYGTQLK